MKFLFAPFITAVLTLFTFSASAQINEQLKTIPHDAKIMKEVRKKGYSIDSNFFKTKDIEMLHFNIDMSKATKRGSGNNAVYSAPFSMVVINKGIAKTGMFYICTYINDYMHPHSGDSWWVRETKITEKIRLSNISGRKASREDYNTIKVLNLDGGKKLAITGRVDLKANRINRYHVTAAADCNRGATNYYSADGRVKETDEYNNKKGVMPRL